MKAFPLFSALFIGLAACAPAPEPAPVFDPNVDVTPGLNDKEPDTCRAGLFTFYVGRPVAEIQAAVADKPLMVIAPGSLGTQDYNAARINAFVDDKGLVYRLSCG
jgi:hypothetical protein